MYAHYHWYFTQGLRKDEWKKHWLGHVSNEKAIPMNFSNYDSEIACRYWIQPMPWTVRCCFLGFVDHSLPAIRNHNILAAFNIFNHFTSSQGPFYCSRFIFFPGKCIRRCGEMCWFVGNIPHGEPLHFRHSVNQHRHSLPRKVMDQLTSLQLFEWFYNIFVRYLDIPWWKIYIYIINIYTYKSLARPIAIACHIRKKKSHGKLAGFWDTLRTSSLPGSPKVCWNVGHPGCRNWRATAV